MEGRDSQNQIRQTVPPQILYNQSTGINFSYFDLPNLDNLNASIAQQQNYQQTTLVDNNPALLSTRLVPVKIEFPDTRFEANFSFSWQIPEAHVLSPQEHENYARDVSSNTSTSNLPSNLRFCLQEQPNPTQRKSYAKEARYITPSPLTITTNEFGRNERNGKVLDGFVSVRLVNEVGEPFKQEGFIECMEGLLQSLKSSSASFSIKFSKITEKPVRLEFIVVYTLLLPSTTKEQKEITYNVTEKILSRPFIVCSNIKKTTKEKPEIIALKENYGDAKEKTEVWIRGRKFHKKVHVRFGDFDAEVTEVTSSLLVVKAPQRRDLKEDTLVTVTVANKFGNSFDFAENRLSFLYKTLFNTSNVTT